ncbi:uncharacterized protein LOC133180146 [Saccostrea echinata]|uniref:uncharacterized protein LOC133180146 n=1 Tax=Saccostrea echinata TaxID=191078 RepID=UPI002A83DD2D|nr:uncharacterized protein LOC133180146 [Saccostrea echinata]
MPEAHYIASNAIDRDKSKCTRNIEIGTLSNIKTVWWRVDLGDIYSINVLFKNYDGYEMRQKGRIAGFSLYLSNSSISGNEILCYKDEEHLPPLNFTTTCAGYGRYVIFYNERLDEYKYPDGYQSSTVTELCEVIVNGCGEAGAYGEKCDEKCPKNCQEQRCNIINGTCVGCLPGWNGTFCEKKCPEGWYGLECKLQCFAHCKDNAFCNHVTGQCDNECADGWKGAFCDEQCLEENYGVDCKFNCSSHCRNDVPCDKQTGHCVTNRIFRKRMRKYLRMKSDTVALQDVLDSKNNHYYRVTSSTMPGYKGLMDNREKIDYQNVTSN